MAEMLLVVNGAQLKAALENIYSSKQDDNKDPAWEAAKKTLGSTLDFWYIVATKPELASHDWDKLEPRLLVHHLAHSLWEDKSLIHTQNRLLVIADPLASLVTVVWSACDKTVDEGFLERFIHRYFQQMRNYERVLAQRPGIQLVLVAKNDSDQPSEERHRQRELKGRFYDTAQHLLRRIGEAALDLQIRWIEEPKDNTLETLLKDILSAHGHLDLSAIPVEPPALALGSRAGKSAYESYKRALSGLAGTRKPLSKGTITWPELDPMLTLDLFLLPEDDGDAKTSPKPTQGSSPQSLLLCTHLKARRFTHHPLRVDFAPVTLIASENASGKTTLVEALAQLYLGRPRVRALLPKDASTFEKHFENAKKEDDNGKREEKDRPLLQALRLTTHPDAALGVSQFLPLFADDAELEHGLLGEVALLSVLPRLDDTDRTHLFEMLEWSADTVEVLRNAAERVRGMSAPEAKTPDLREGAADLKEAWEKALLDLVAEEAKAVNERKKKEISYRPDVGLLGSAPSASVTSDDAKLEQLKSLLESLKQPVPPKSETTSEDAASEEAVPPSPALSPALLQQLETHFALFLPWLEQHKPPSWTMLQPHWESPEVFPRLRDFIALRLEDQASRLERRMRTFVVNLERTALGDSDALSKLEQEVYHYLDIGFELPRPGFRPNTARQVRHAFAARLARWLLATGGTLPILVIDEPVLGQDASAAGAAMGRFLRLRRIHEGKRWVDAWPLGLAQVSVVRDQWTPPADAERTTEETSEQATENTPTKPLPLVPDQPLPFSLGVATPPAETPSMPGWPPLPPQVILASHLSSTLVAAADSEGVVVDLDLQGKLRSLIPSDWLKLVRGVLAAVSTEWNGTAQSKLEGNWRPLAAAALVRCWLGDSGAFPLEVSKPFEWKCEACKKLVELKLYILAFQLETANTDDTYNSMARRLLLWMIGTDLLPAILADGQAGFEVSGLALRQLPASGGEALELGPSRLRRIAPWLEILPKDPVKQKVSEEPKSEKVVQASRLQLLEKEEDAGGTPPPLSKTDREAISATSLPEPQEPDQATTEALTPAPISLSTSEAEPEPEPAQAPALEPVQVLAHAPQASDLNGTWRILPVGTSDDIRKLLKRLIRSIGMLPTDTHSNAHLALKWDEDYLDLGQVEIPETVTRVFARSVALILPKNPTPQIASPQPLTQLAEELDKPRDEDFIRWLERQSRLREKVLMLWTETLPQALGKSLDTPLAFGLWSYLEDEVADPEVRLSFGMLPSEVESLSTPEKQKELLGLLRVREEQGLELLRQTLASNSRFFVRLYPKCLLGMAVRAGVIYNHRTGFHVEVMQNGSPWDVDLQKVRVRPAIDVESWTPGLTNTGRTNTVRGELHVLISYSQGVRPQYERWLESKRELSVAQVLHLQPPGGPSRDSVQRDTLTDLAETLIEKVFEARRTGQAIRFFIAAPVALAVALGRSMNALGQIHLMDYLREEETYVETFAFKC